MSDINLNQPTPHAKPPERFDLKRHVHEEKPFLSGVGMLFMVVIGGLSLMVSFLGGGYLLAGGTVPEFTTVVHKEEPKPDEPKKLTPEQVKSTEESVKELFAQYGERWNAGEFPKDLLTSDFYVTTESGKRITSPSEIFDPGAKIQANQVKSLTQLSDGKARAEVWELSKRKTTMQQWYSNVERSDHVDELFIERVTNYEYEVQRSGSSWKIASRKWLAQNGARIRQVGDGEEDLKMSPESVRFEDKRLNREVLQPRYDSMAASLSNFTFPSNENFKDYHHVMGDGKERTAEMLQMRLDRAHAWILAMKVTSTVETVDQIDDVRASADVKFKAEFQLKGSNNLYVAVWRDRDTWAKAKGTDSWYRLKTDRIYRSPLMEHYEEREGPKQAPSTASPGLKGGEE